MAKPVVQNELSRYTKLTDDACHRIVAASRGEVGCLAGDTLVVTRRQARHTRTRTLEQLHQQFNGVWSERPWPTYLQSCADDETLFYNRITSVVEAGVKQLVNVVFDDDTNLRATPDHPILTTNGFVEAGSLQASHTIIGRGSCAAISRGGRRQPQSAERAHVYVKYHPYGSYRAVSPAHSRVVNHKTYEYKEVARSRVVLEAIANNLDYDEFIHILNTDPNRAWLLRFMPPDFEVHHKDENKLNDAPDNLQVMTTQEHARHHSARLNFLKDYRRTKRMRRLVNDATEMTYDIQMAAPAHNFCAGQTVVHNSGKTSWWLGAPGPILVQTLDQGLEGVAETFTRVKDIYVAKYDLGRLDVEFSHALAVEARDKFTEDFESGIKAAIKGNLRTIIWDRESDMWDLFFFAEFGTDDAFAAAPAKDWDRLKGKIRRLISMAKEINVNFGMIQGMKNEWGSSINPKNGKKQSSPTGNRITAGMEGINALAHVEIEHVRTGGDFGINVGKSRGPGSRSVQDKHFDNVSFADFAQLVFPESDESEWL